MNTAGSASPHFLLGVYHTVQENGFKCLEPQSKDQLGKFYAPDFLFNLH